MFKRKAQISASMILAFLFLISVISVRPTFAQDPTAQLTVTPADVVIAGESITVGWDVTSTADSLYLHITYHFPMHSAPDTTWLVDPGSHSVGEKIVDTSSSDLSDVDITISTGEDPFGPGDIVSQRVSVQHGQSQPPTAAEPCPESGVWPTGCEAPPPSSVGKDVPCPASGVWPAGCNPNLPPAPPTDDCVIPPSGPWPPCATAGDPPPPDLSGNCVIPSSGPWPVCASGGSDIPTDRTYRLQNMFLGDGKCLEGNRPTPGSTLNGVAFMDECQNVSG